MNNLYKALKEAQREYLNNKTPLEDARKKVHDFMEEIRPKEKMSFDEIDQFYDKVEAFEVSLGVETLETNFHNAEDKLFCIAEEYLRRGFPEDYMKIKEVFTCPAYFREKVAEPLLKL